MKRLILALFILFTSCSRENPPIPKAEGVKLYDSIELSAKKLKEWGVYEPDTFLRFSPKGDLLAVGTFFGELILYSIPEKRILWRKRIPEGMVKKIDFSPDGKILYFGEQSPDGFIYACRVGDGKILWRFRLSKDLGTGVFQKALSQYSIYSLPGCYRIKVLKDGDIVVLGIHSYFDGKSWRRRSRIYRLNPKGEAVWAFPKDAPMEATMIYMDSDPAGKRVVAVSTSTSSLLPEGYPYTGGTLYVLDGKTGKEVGRYRFKPLKPYYKEVSFWQSVSVDERGKLCVLGTSDGRVFLFDLDMVKPILILSLGTPIMVGDVPVSARSTYVLLKGGVIYVETGPSSIPYGLGIKSTTPPGPHPNANTLWAISLKGKILWRFSPSRLFEFQGYACDSQGRYLAVCGDSSVLNPAERVFGLFLFDTKRKGGALEKLIAFYPTLSPCFFHLDMTRDGRFVAFCEVPYRDPVSGKYMGRYRVLILERR